PAQLPKRASGAEAPRDPPPATSTRALAAWMAFLHRCHQKPETPATRIPGPPAPPSAAVPTPPPEPARRPGESTGRVHRATPQPSPAKRTDDEPEGRSEERRVGKGCRSRWETAQEKVKS